MFAGFLERGGLFGFDGGGEVDGVTDHIEHTGESGAVTGVLLDVEGERRVYKGRRISLMNCSEKSLSDSSIPEMERRSK